MNRVWLAHTAAATIFSEASRHTPLESGGLLLGYRSEQDTVVLEATVPGPACHRERSIYRPDQDYDEEVIRLRFDETDRLVTYLGDWHSHPHSGSGRPSWKDQRTIGRIAEYSEADCPEPLMCIAYTSDTKERNWRVAAWRGRRRRIGLFRLVRVEQMDISTF